MLEMKKTDPDQVDLDRIDCIIGKGTRFEGVIYSGATLRVDGEYKGNLEIKGDLIIGETGEVVGSIEGHRNVLVGGIVNGQIFTPGEVEIAPTGKLYGDMKVGNLLVEIGAVFKGNCSMDVEKNQLKAQETVQETAQETVYRIAQEISQEIVQEKKQIKLPSIKKNTDEHLKLNQFSENTISSDTDKTNSYFLDYLLHSESEFEFGPD